MPCVRYVEALIRYQPPCRWLAASTPATRCEVSLSWAPPRAGLREACFCAYVPNCPCPQHTDHAMQPAAKTPTCRSPHIAGREEWKSSCWADSGRVSMDTGGLVYKYVSPAFRHRLKWCSLFMSSFSTPSVVYLYRTASQA